MILVVTLVSDTVPLLDELCRRVMNFINTCLNCDSHFVREIILHGISAGSLSIIGRNTIFCSLRYNMHTRDIGKKKLTGSRCLELFKNKLNVESIDRATALREVIYVREGLYEFSNSIFSTDDVNTLIQLLAC